MRHCKGIQVLIRILPFRSRWSARLRQHLERCRKCREDLADLEEARTATISREKMGQEMDFWPVFLRQIESTGPPLIKTRPRLAWRWALSAVGLVAAAAVVGLLLFRPGTGNDPDSDVKLRIQSVRMYDQPAQVYIFQTRDTNRTFVWVEKQESREVL